MTGRVAYIFLGILLGWFVFALTGLVLDPWGAVIIGLGLGGALTWAGRRGRALGGVMAVLEPIGVVLPILALWHMAGAVGVPVPRLSVAELLVFFVAYVTFLAAAVGALPFQPYRLGYAPGPVAVMVLAACAYGLITANPLIPLIAVAGQALWVARIGSSNWFDHVLHAVLVPVAVITLLTRLF